MLVVRAFQSSADAKRNFTVRAISDTRFADATNWGSSPEKSLRLTPGSYAVRVSSAGFEPAEISNVKIESGVTTDLGSVALRPGIGRIVAEIDGSVNPNRAVAIALIGRGRHRCDRCYDASTEAIDLGDDDALDRSFVASRAPCPVCGFGAERSLLVVPPSGRVEFTNLASDSYTLRVVDDRERPIGDEHVVELESGATANVRLDASWTRTLEIEWFDADGASLSAEWSRRLATAKSDDASAPIDRGTTRSIAIRMSLLQDSREIATAGFLPPPLPGATQPGESLGDFATRRRGPRPATDDRPRTASDSLRPIVAAEHFSASTAECELLSDGATQLHALPESAFEVRATAGKLAADALVPPSGASARIRLELHPRSENKFSSPATYREAELGRAR